MWPLAVKSLAIHGYAEAPRDLVTSSDDPPRPESYGTAKCTHVCIYIYGGSLKLGYPQIIHSSGVFHY